MKIRGLYKLDSILIILIFIVSIYTPFIASFIMEDKDISIVEKRSLAAMPNIPRNSREISKFPQQFNTYYSDQFSFRDWFYKNYNRLILKIDKDSASSDVTFGQDGWMFLGTLKPGYNKYSDPMGDAININLYSHKQLQLFAQSITAINNWLHERGIEYIFVIAPNKHTIYFDRLPAYIKKLSDRSATDQLVEHLHTHTEVRVLDLRPALMTQKNNKQLYYKTDTHWNHNGANIAQYEISQVIEKIFPGKIEPALLSDSDYIVSSKSNGDLAGFANMDNAIEEELTPVFQKSCNPVKIPNTKKWDVPFTMICDNRELNAVIFRDSFFIHLEPYITRQFNRSTYIWKKLDYETLRQYIDQENPAIVIDEWAERLLPNVMPTTEFARLKLTEQP